MYSLISSINSVIGVVQGCYPVGLCWYHRKLGQHPTNGHLCCIFGYGRREMFQTVWDYLYQHLSYKEAMVNGIKGFFEIDKDNIINQSHSLCLCVRAWHTKLRVARSMKNLWITCYPLALRIMRAYLPVLVCHKFCHSYSVESFLHKGICFLETAGAHTDVHIHH